MPYSYLPQMSYLTVNDGMIEFFHEGKLLMTMTPEEARSNAADLLDAADKAEGKGAWSILSRCSRSSNIDAAPCGEQETIGDMPDRSLDE